MGVTTFFEKVFKGAVKFAATMILLTTLVGAWVVGYFSLKGYGMYKDAVNEKSVVELTTSIQREEGFVALSDISSEFKEQLIESEDKEFYEHCGISLKGIGRAVVEDVKARAFVQGGSTITQQLAKNLYFTGEKKMERKFAELFVVYTLEHLYSKDEILELYCNVIYFGEGCYGIQEAAQNYYGVDALYLDKDEAASLVFTIKCPTYYNPNAYGKSKKAA